MGLLKDALGPAFGAGQVNNGMNGPMSTIKRSFGKSNSLPSPSPEPPPSMSPRPNYDYCQPDSPYQQQDMQSSGRSRNRDRFRQRQERREGRRNGGRNNDRRSYRYPEQVTGEYTLSNAPRPHQAPMGGRGWSQDPSFNVQQHACDRTIYSPSHHQENLRYDDEEYTQPQAQQSLVRNGQEDGMFRPLALPQIAHGEGKPFLRGYSDESRQYGVSEDDFIQTVDKINKAIIPNPETQIFQKAAQITDHFV